MTNEYIESPYFKDIVELIYKKEFLDANLKLDLLLLKDQDNFFLNNLKGVILLNLRDLDNAEIYLNKSIILNSSFVEAYSNLGIVLFLKKNFLEAIKSFEHCITSKEKLDFYYLNIGNCYRELSNFQDSLKYYEQALSKNPNNYEIFFNLGILYLSIPKNFNKAISFFEKSIEINKKNYLSYFFLGRCYNLKKNFLNAIYNLKKSIEINPEHYKAYEEICYSFYFTRQLNLCLTFAEKCLVLDPKNTKSYLAIFSSYQLLGEKDKAYKFLLKALRFNKKNHEIWNNLGVNAQSKGSFFKAKKYYNRSLKLFENFHALKNIGQCFLESHNPTKGLDYIKKAKDSPDSSIAENESYIFHSNYLLDYSQKQYLGACEEYRSKVIANNASLYLSTFRNLKLQNISPIKLKVGFISGDFNRHAVAIQIIDILQELKKISKIELFFYYNNFKIDDVTKEFINLTSNWKNILSFSDEEVFNLIKSDNLNILVDLSGYTDGNRLPVLIAKPAPIQISWCGYLQSLGIPEIDYIISDPHCIPQDLNHLYLEKILKLPNIWSQLCLRKISNHPLKITPALKNNYITFGSFNHDKKINIKVIETWSRILNLLPNSKLVIFLGKTLDSYSLNELKNIFFQNKVNETQLVINSHKMPRDQLLECYNQIDISLDTFPYSGGTTSLESIAMCVPIITLVGSLFLSRTGYSVNMNADLKEWCCKNEEEYINKAIYFSNNIKKLNEVRVNLYNNRLNNPAFNNNIFAQNFITILEQVWNNHIIENV